jgi:hypothetical protein
MVNWIFSDREDVADICLRDQIWEDPGCFVMLVKAEAGIAASEPTAAQPIPFVVQGCWRLNRNSVKSFTHK